jgi:hypothetical protein
LFGFVCLSLVLSVLMAGWHKCGTYEKAGLSPAPTLTIPETQYVLWATIVHRGRAAFEDVTYHVDGVPDVGAAVAISISGA